MIMQTRDTLIAWARTIAQSTQSHAGSGSLTASGYEAVRVRVDVRSLACWGQGTGSPR